MNTVIFFIVPALLAFYPVQSSAQDLNSWGSIFDCAVDWFSQCKAVRDRTDRTNQAARCQSKYFLAFRKVHCCEPAITREERP